MKLTYRDKMLLLGVLAAAIILLGIFLGIKPKTEEIKEDNATLAQVEETWQGIDAKIQQIGGLQDDIKTSYTDSAKLSDDFVDLSVFGINYTGGKVEKSNGKEQYMLDEYMQSALDECKIEVKSLDLGEPTVTELGYYYFTPSVLTSSMFDAADINGEYATAINEARAESDALTARTREAVVRTQYGVMGYAGKEDIWAFMEKIDSLDTTIVIDSVSIADYTFGEEARKTDPTAEEKSDVTFIISIYSVFPMDEPVVE